MGSEEMTCSGCDDKTFIRSSYICEFCGNGYCEDCCDNIVDVLINDNDNEEYEMIVRNTTRVCEECSAELK